MYACLFHVMCSMSPLTLAMPFPYLNCLTTSLVPWW